VDVTKFRAHDSLDVLQTTGSVLYLRINSQNYDKFFDVSKLVKGELADYSYTYTSTTTFVDISKEWNSGTSEPMFSTIKAAIFIAKFATGILGTAVVKKFDGTDGCTLVNT
jgi:hypothetical protein